MMLSVSFIDARYDFVRLFIDALYNPIRKRKV